jgi:hypothetical protein
MTAFSTDLRDSRRQAVARDITADRTDDGLAPARMLGFALLFALGMLLAGVGAISIAVFG